MRSPDSAAIVKRLAELRQEHRSLDAMISDIGSEAGSDQLTLTRLKKRKLRLKDDITRLESRLIPDLDA